MVDETGEHRGREGVEETSAASVDATPVAASDKSDSSQDQAPKPRHRKRRKVLITLAVLVVLVVIGLLGLVQWRRASRQAALPATDAATPQALSPAAGAQGRFEAHVDYTSMAATNANVSTTITWDDDWFFQDPTVYNHELATTCSVLSALANAESSYYQAGSSAPAYMENALSALGFTDVSTSSYQWRSEVVDEIVNFLTGSNDVTAYSIAAKRVTSSTTGATKTLLMVSVRGSYGSEWISDANMGDLASLELLEGDHVGFAEPAEEIIERLQQRISQLTESGEASTNDIALLFCGHSRGGAVANVAASYADDYSDSLRPLATPSNIWCYAFAVPRDTTMSNAHDALYDNIFNIQNPSDMVPRLPLATWGFSRYGHDLWLPSYGTDAFNASYESMREHFRENVGAESPYDPADLDTVNALERRLSEEVPTQEDLTTPGGLASTLRSVALDMNAARVLYGHYTNTYIAWMQAIDPTSLTDTHA